MARRKRRSKAGGKKADDETLWSNAHERELANELTLQMVGLRSPTSTVFARIVLNGSCCAHFDMNLGQVVNVVAEEFEKQSGNHKSTCDLFYLGSVWLVYGSRICLPPRRLTLEDARSLPEEIYGSSLRIHFNPQRYPFSWRICDAIVHEDKEIGFVVLDKPGGIPVHSTVDNGVENVLSMFQEYLRSEAGHGSVDSTRGDTPVTYTALPQRLDTETSGLLLVSMKREFQSFMSRMLQQKTLHHTQEDDNDARGLTNCTVKKKYRCLVCLHDIDQWRELCLLKSTHSIVTHYLDSNSAAPKTFVPDLPQAVADQGSNNIGWLQCQLRIVDVGEVALPVDDISPASRMLRGCLWKENQTSKPTSCSFVVEVETELLTGRTHQIRGQLSSLGCPIVGDPLYGGGGDVCAKEMRSCNVMALQCCELVFLQPKWTPTVGKRGKLRQEFVPSAIRRVFRLDRAWWTGCLAEYKKHMRR